MSPLDRRQFLKGSAGATVGLLAPGILGRCAGSDDRSDGLGQDSVSDGEAVAPPDRPPEVVDDASGSEAPGTVHALTSATLADLSDLGTRAAIALGITGTALAGATVFLKPNFVILGMQDVFGVTFDPESGENTKAELVVAVAEQCLKCGAARVTIGEGAQGAAWDWSTVGFVPGNAWRGVTTLPDAVAGLQAEYGAERIVLSNLNETDEWDYVPSSSPDPALADGIPVARAFARADLVISMPVAKTHQWSGVTAALKNYVGLGALKHLGGQFHRCRLHLGYTTATCFGVADAGINGAFMDIVAWRRAQAGKRDYAIVDGTICLEGDGPQKAGNKGKTLHTRERNASGHYYVLAARDLADADRAAARLMGFDPDDIKALAMARNAGFGTEDVTLVGATFADLSVPDWKKPKPMSDSFFKAFCS
jgi:uncharacterized protein (DUF362 family)